MKRIEIIEGVYSSVIGFGCSSILGAVDGKKAKRAIDIALDCGINHFDLARSYGYGDAEAFVGKVLKNKRHEVVIASKFGIIANWKAQVFKPLKPVVRFLKRRKDVNVNTKNENIKINTDRFHNRLPITSKLLVTSLEKSLKALKTDYLDIFLIHEPLQTISEIEQVLKTAEILKKEGKIRGFGLACMQEQMIYHQEYLDKFDILQFNNSPSLTNYDNIKRNRARHVNIFFTPFSSNGGVSISPEEKLKTILFDFPESVVLCSMFSENHIRANTNIAKLI